jgi:hypothetical protein
MNLINFIVWLSAGGCYRLVCQPDGYGRTQADPQTIAWQGSQLLEELTPSASQPVTTEAVMYVPTKNPE